MVEESDEGKVCSKEDFFPQPCTKSCACHWWSLLEGIEFAVKDAIET